jgi:hypothetical protein
MASYIERRSFSTLLNNPPQKSDEQIAIKQTLLEFRQKYSEELAHSDQTAL